MPIPIKSRPGYDEMRDFAFGLIENHEVEKHSGEACFDERINLVAWLCHCLGLDEPEAIVSLIERISDYHEHHHNRKHGH